MTVPRKDLTPLTRLLQWTPTLLFHEVLADDTSPLPMYAMTRSRLREVLADFAGRGFTSGTVEDILRRGQSKKLVLTFDDGTSDFIPNALPVLEEFGFGATLLIVSGLVGRRRTWIPPDGTVLDPVPLMNADELRALHARGLTLGSHTVSHPSLPLLTAQQAREELVESKRTLEDLTGERVRWFAYPYVAATVETQAIVRESGYEGALGGYNARHSRYYMNRIEASLFTLPQLRLRSNGLYLATRYLARRIRKAG